MPLHRAVSVYAEDFETEYAKAVAYAITQGEDWTSLTREQMVTDWAGYKRWDADGWPLTTRNDEHGRYDYWSVGGVGGGFDAWWVLKEGAPTGPLSAVIDQGDDRPHTFNARLHHLEAESLLPVYAFLDLDGSWHSRWIGPTREEATSDRMPTDGGSAWTMPADEWAVLYLKFIADLPGHTWLVDIDYHH